jgi:glycosyltransferase 2 family protein
VAGGRAVLTEPVTERATRRGLWSWLLLAVVLAIGAYVVVRNRQDLGTAFREIGWGAMAASAVFGVVGTAVLLGLWKSVLRALGATVPLEEAWRVFFVSQLGKYLPGLVWPALAQMEAGRRWGVRRSVMLTANLLMIAMLTGSGVVVGLVLLPGLAGISGWGAWALAAVLLSVCLWPRLLTAVIDRVFALVHREPPRITASPRDMAVSFAWAVAVWFLYGLHVWFLVRAVGGTGGDAWVAATGGIALAWALGLVAVLAPAGVGVRDAVLFAVLSPLVGRTAALAVVLASRGLLALTDVVLAAVAAAGPSHAATRSGVAQE